MPGWLKDLLPILGILAAIVLVVGRLPKVDLGHSPAFVRRRTVNWLTVGMTYAFLYMGRYNLNVCTGDKPEHLFDKGQFGTIYAWGALVYGLSFVVNGPLTDKIGGRKTIILSAVGSSLANLGMGALSLTSAKDGVVPMEARAGLVPLFSVLYSANMYFQSFGAVSIVKINSAWFHLRERGTFGGIFGILISLGIYFAFDWSRLVFDATSAPWVFFVPAAILLVFGVLDALFVRDTPGQAGQADFELGDATKEGDEKLGLTEVAKRMLKNPVILTIALVEFCSGYLRNAIMQFYRPFANETGRGAEFVASNWGMLNCVAGMLGGVVAGVVSDKVFGSRRGPVAGVLYGVMIVGALAMFPALHGVAIGWVVVVMSLAIIGVHGMLSGTASMDFGGKHNTGVAVGIIDGFVYLGVSAEAVVLKRVLPVAPANKDPANWWTWPAAILPVAIIGLALALRVWNAKPGSKAAAH